MTNTIGRAAVASTTILIAILLAGAPAAGGVDDFPGQTALEVEHAKTRDRSSVDDVRVATVPYHDVARATADGFAPITQAGTTPAACGQASDGSGVR